MSNFPRKPWFRSGWWRLGGQVSLAAMLGVGAGWPAPSGPEPEALYASGLRALDEGLPQVATYKLGAFLQSDPAPADRRAGTLALVRAFLAVPDARAALTTLDGEFPSPPTPADAADPALAFWRGQVLAALGRWPEALAHYTQAANAPGIKPPLDAQAQFGRGEALLAMSGNGDATLQAEAAAVYRSLQNHPLLGRFARLRYAEIALDSHRLKDASHALGDLTPETDPGGHALTKEHAYLVGRLRLAQHQPALAQQIFTQALPPPEERKAGLTPRLLVDNYWGWARACVDEDQPDQAQAALEHLLAQDPPPEFLAQAFTWLETLCSRSVNPDLTELTRWAEDDLLPEREAYARITLAHLEVHVGRPELADPILASFPRHFPGHPLRVRALLDLAALRLNLGRTREARAALRQARQMGGTDTRWRTGIETLDARIALAENDSVQAAERFTALAARLGTGALAEAAAFNAVLASLRSGDAGRYDTARGKFETQFPHSALAAEFPLEEGLARAEQISAPDSAEQRDATGKLRSFLAEHPTHRRVPEARITLAELAFQQVRPDVLTAQGELAEPRLRPVSNDAPDPTDLAESDRADYLAIWLADAPGPEHDGERAVTLAKKFLETRPDSPLAAETRMKLGEIYFGRGDNPDAQTQLELLIRDFPSSPLVDAAHYLAGQAAASSMSATGMDRAVEHYNQVANHDGPFRLPARLRLAELMLDNPNTTKDALVLYNEVLTSTGGDAPLGTAELAARCAALCGKGQTLLALGGNDPSRYPEAVATFDQLAAHTPGASLHWRRQALTLKGKVFEKTGDTDAALAAYDDALDAAPDPAVSPESTGPEWTWFYRAGRDAANLLEAKAQWAAAIAVYKKLAAADGPMKSEFERTLANKRLEHFIWED